MHPHEADAENPADDAEFVLELVNTTETYCPVPVTVTLPDDDDVSVRSTLPEPDDELYTVMVSLPASEIELNTTCA